MKTKLENVSEILNFIGTVESTIRILRSSHLFCAEYFNLSSPESRAQARILVQVI
jgi:hypothetical protein